MVADFITQVILYALSAKSTIFPPANTASNSSRPDEILQRPKKTKDPGI